MDKKTPSTAAKLDVGRYETQNRRRLSAPGLRAFIAITDLWRLSEDQRRLMLGSPSQSTYQNWCRIARQHGSLTLDVGSLKRISAILGIHQALGVLFANEADRLAWLQGPHDAPLFGGRCPLEVATSGSLDGLLRVRRFLDAACEGIYMAPNGLDSNAWPYDESEIGFE